MKIGNIELKHGLALAPMAGITDRAYRQICKMYGSEYAVTEMISAKAVHYHDKNTVLLSDLTEFDNPIGIQIFGSEPEIMAEAAKALLDREKHAQIIDINMGCPVRKVVSNGEGSALMKNPSLVFNIVSAVKKAVDVPVTVKFRRGVDDAHINAVEIAKSAESAGADAVCVHGRTAAQLYAPPVCIDTIAEVKQSIKIPVFGNGDINTAEDALRMLEYTHCDGLMLARGTMGNPWLFDEILCALDGKVFTPPTSRERLMQAKEHLRLLIADKGEFIGVNEGRKHFSYYIKGFEGASAYRNRINSATSAEEFYSIIEEIDAKI